nr:ATP-binding protein [uncultured Polaribacter sp.]
MELERSKIILITTTLIIVLAILLVIFLFSIFQKRKNKLLIEREESKKRFEREIAETQIEIREETLRNISWELHDNIGQLLTLAKIQLQSVTDKNIHEVSDTISKSLTEIRALSKLINPEAIKNINLKEAIQLEIDRFNRLNFIASSLIIKGTEQKINKKHSIIIFRILQEFFSNTIKHSKASELKVILDFTEKNILISACDNGIGFEINQNKIQGIGLQNIKNRAKLINAEATFLSEKNKGTTLHINYNL